MYELLNVEGKNYIVHWDASGASYPDGVVHTADDYEWFTVPTPDGMTDDEFAANVISAFNTERSARQGQPYSREGHINSNNFAWSVIVRAGGQVPNDVRSGRRLIPGICGGIPPVFSSAVTNTLAGLSRGGSC